MNPRVPLAIAAGERASSGLPFFKVLCPHCQGPQWVQAGVSDCFGCGGTFQYVPLTLIVSNKPPVNPPV